MGVGALIREIAQLPDSFMKVFGGLFLLFRVLPDIRPGGQEKQAKKKKGGVFRRRPNPLHQMVPA